MVSHLPHAELARLIHEDAIDVLVNLNGYTKGSRNEASVPGGGAVEGGGMAAWLTLHAAIVACAHGDAQVFAMCPAPIQAMYLGFPGSSGASFMQYFVTDPVATPPASAHLFTER
jgi:protein O-GlcNAc transferase